MTTIHRPRHAPIRTWRNETFGDLEVILQLIVELLEEFMPAALSVLTQERGQRLETDLSRDVCVKADRLILREALMNASLMTVRASRLNTASGCSIGFIAWRWKPTTAQSRPLRYRAPFAPLSNVRGSVFEISLPLKGENK